MTEDRSTELFTALREQRRHVLGIVTNLSDVDLRRPVLSSGWSCLSLINHLSLGVELFWFRAVVAGSPKARAELVAAGDVWQVDADLPAERVLAGYRHKVELADRVLATVPLDVAPAWWPAADFDGWRLHTTRAVILHVITETACHAGHLDAARELIDGSQWLVLGEQRTGLALSS
jgi:uncharacterized damage-inducible protein DinB